MRSHEDGPGGAGDVDPGLVLVGVHPGEGVKVVVGQIEPGDDEDGREAEAQGAQHVSLPRRRKHGSCADLSMVGLGVGWTGGRAW